MKNSDSIALVAEKWSKHEQPPDLEKRFWNFPPLSPYLIRSAFGEDLAMEHQHNKFWAEDMIVSKYLRNRNIESVFSLCCGFGHVERRIIPQLLDVKKCVAVDIATGALEVARQKAREAGLDHVIDYVCADLNNYTWEEGKYDLVIANGALHHLVNLEDVLQGIKLTLRENGIFYANEHVGASYQDYPVRQLELINAVAYLVPPELRKRIGTPFRHSHKFLLRLYKLYDILSGNRTIPNPDDRPMWSKKRKMLASILRRISERTGRGKDQFHFGIVRDSQKEHLLRTDPSECVRSSEIIPLTKKCFTEVEIRSYGGGILAYALDKKFYEDYDHSNPVHRKTLDILCQLEEHFIQTNQIDIEYAIIIAKK